jgi:hypothetical protein
LPSSCAAPSRRGFIHGLLGLPSFASSTATFEFLGVRCRIIAEPDVDPALLAPWLAEVREFAGADRILADAWLTSLAPAREMPRIFITRRPLATTRCVAVFGYASRRARAAIVSLAGLDSGTPEQTRRRLHAVIAHEVGHLAGYRHCHTPGCVMRPAKTPADLDTRCLALCPACRRRRAWLLAVALLVSCVAISLLLDTAMEKIRNRTQVFRWRADGDGAALMLEGKEILRLRSPAAAQARAGALNALYASMAPPSLEVARNGSDVRIVAGGRDVVVMSQVETNGAAPEEFARRWAARMDPFLQGKGPREQGCPSCHVARRSEVLEAMNQRSRWWRLR